MRLDVQQLPHHLLGALFSTELCQTGRQNAQGPREPRVLRQCALRAGRRLFKLAGREVRKSRSRGHVPRSRVARAQPFGALQQLQGLLRVAQHGLVPTSRRQGNRRIRIQLQRATKQFSCAVRICPQRADGKSRHPQGIGVVLAKLDGPRGQRQARCRVRIHGIGPALVVPFGIAIGGKRHRRSVGGLNRQGLLQTRKRCRKARLGELVFERLRRSSRS
jgi:hypothetical protein